jgi:hypothetical protein
VRARVVVQDGKWMYTGSEDGTIKIWDVRAPGCQREYESGCAINSVALHANQVKDPLLPLLPRAAAPNHARRRPPPPAAARPPPRVRPHCPRRASPALRGSRDRRPPPP